MSRGPPPERTARTLKHFLPPLFLLLLGAFLAWFFRLSAVPFLFLGGREVSLSPPPPADPPRALPSRRRVLSSPRQTSPAQAKDSIRPAQGRACLSGRILGPEGTPLANRVFRFTYIKGQPGTPTARARLLGGKTDKKGLFRLPFDPPPTPAAPVTLEIRPMGSDGRPAGKTFLRKPLLDRYPPGIHFLGDLFLEERPLLASGRVMDLSGKPLKGVEIRAWYLRPPLVPPSPGKKPEKVWAPLPFSDRSAPGGRFEIRGETASTLLQLRASAKDKLQENPPLVPSGSRGVALFLHPAGWMEGKVLPPPGTSPQSFVLQVFPSAWEGRAPFFRQTFPGKKGDFLVGGLPPGPARLVVKNLLDGHKVLELKGLVVSPGNPCPDPRLQALDLSGGREPLHLILADASGRPLREALALALPGPLRIYRGPGRNFPLPGAERDKTLFLWAPGFLVKSLDPPIFPGQSQARVTLKKGIPLRVSLDPSLPAPPPPARLRVRLSLFPPRGGAPHQVAAAFFLGRSGLPSRSLPGTRSALEFRLPSPGVYKPAWGIQAGSGLRARTVWAPPGEGSRPFRVSLGSRPLRILLRPRRAVYLSLLKRALASYPPGHDEK